MTMPYDRSPARFAMFLLAAAWLIWFSGFCVTRWLNANFSGLGDDVVDSLNRSHFLAVRVIWFNFGSVFLDGVAGVLLWTVERLTWAGLAVWLILAISVGWHGLNLLAAWFSL